MQGVFLLEELLHGDGYWSDAQLLVLVALLVSHNGIEEAAWQHLSDLSLRVGVSLVNLIGIHIVQISDFLYGGTLFPVAHLVELNESLFDGERTQHVWRHHLTPRPVCRAPHSEPQVRGEHVLDAIIVILCGERLHMLVCHGLVFEHLVG